MFFSLLWNKKGTVALVGILVAALSFLALIVLEKPFKVRTDFLITQNSSNSQDLYALSRSAEYVSKVLSEAAYSERFIEAVVETGKVPSTFLPTNKKDRLEAWAQEVKVQKNLELGMVQVEVLGNDQMEASRISQAIAEVMTQKNILFRGGDEKAVDVRILSGPIVDRNPSVQEMVLVVIGGFLFGSLLTLLNIFAKQQRGIRTASMPAYGQSTPAFPEFFEPNYQPLTPLAQRSSRE